MVLTVGASAIALLTACFAAPNPPVLFACEPEGAAACPSGYTCHIDGCCHRDGSDLDEHEGACRIGMGDSPPQTTTHGGTDTQTGTGTAGSSSTADADSTSTGSIDSTGSSDTSGSTGSSDTAGTAGDSSSGSSGTDASDTGSSSSDTSATTGEITTR
jgi:hypothetical protein